MLLLQVTHLYDDEPQFSPKTKPNAVKSLDKKMEHLKIGLNSPKSVTEDWKINVLKKLKAKFNNKFDSNIRKSNFEIETTNLESKKHYEDDKVVRYEGKVTLEKMERRNIERFILLICNDYELENYWFSFIDNFLENIFKFRKTIGNQSISFGSFKLGTIVNLTEFVTHFNSDKYNWPTHNSYSTPFRISQDESDKLAEFVHDKRCLIIKFRIVSKQKITKGIIDVKYIRYKFEIKYESIRYCIVKSFQKEWNGKKSNWIKLYISLKQPALFYKNFTDEKLGKKENIHCIETDSTDYWLRENEFPGVKAETIGKINVFVLEIAQLSHDNGYRKYYFDKIDDPWGLIVDLKRYAEIPIYLSNIKEYDAKRISLFPSLINTLPFGVLYAYQSVFCFNFQSQDELGLGPDKRKLNKFQQKVMEFNDTNSTALEETLFEISSAIENGSIIRINVALDFLFQKKRRKPEIPMESFDTDIRFIRKCVLTPTRLLLFQSEPSLKSRFTIKFDTEYSLRLSIREDNMKMLAFSLDSSGEINEKQKLIKRWFINPISKGIKIGNRVYEFLGSSTSQMRDNGMTLYAIDALGRTAESIRNSIGDMSKLLRNVPKYVARLGLAFSHGLIHIKIDPRTTSVYVIDDIYGGKKPFQMDEHYIISDGIGMISPELAEDIYRLIPNEFLNKPSAMQIRFRGCKGMIVVNPKLKDKTLVFRKSMEKFDSDDDILGILKFSAPRPVYLNRPLIVILESLKVPGKVFLNVLMQELLELANASTCECLALKLIEKYSYLRLPYEKIKNSGIPILSEPLFRQFVDQMNRFNVDLLKTKARIKLPMNEGRTVFGVLDETGTLEYGQVFIRISDVDDNKMMNSNDKYIILTGEVMVTKFPCMHPGDVRKFEAIDVPDLHQIKDCIVFPAKGYRSHPDEMAGSDLDGDEYAIFWNSKLIFKQPNIEPMDYPSGKFKELDHDVTVNDILDFYFQYMMGNNIGIIANAHLAKADCLPGGVFEKSCIDLAAKYALALDFAKTGVGEGLRNNEKPKMYPDFMEKYDHRKTYLSDKILGKLYKQCCRFQMSVLDNRFLTIKYKRNQQFNLKGWEKYKHSAIEAFNLYKLRITFLMEKFGIKSEPQLLTGSFTNTEKQFLGKNESLDFHDLIERLVNEVFNELKFKFEDEIEYQNLEEVKLRAAAWYNICYEMNETSQMKYYGFPWTISEYICLIGNAQVEHQCSKHSAQIIDNDYEEWLKQNKSPNNCKELNGDGDLNGFDILFDKVKCILKPWISNQIDDYEAYDKSKDLIDDIFKELKSEMINEYQNQNSLPSLGQIIIRFMKSLIKQFLCVDIFDKSKSCLFPIPIIKFGFSALKTLDHLFRTENAKHIFEGKSKCELQICKTFYVELPKQKTNQRKIDYFCDENMNLNFSDVFNRNRDKIKGILQSISRVSEIAVEVHKVPGSFDQYYYLITAFGSIWEIEILKSVITNRSFYDDITSLYANKMHSM